MCIRDRDTLHISAEVARLALHPDNFTQHDELNTKESASQAQLLRVSRALRFHSCANDYINVDTKTKQPEPEVPVEVTEWLRHCSRDTRNEYRRHLEDDRCKPDRPAANSNGVAAMIMVAATGPITLNGTTGGGTVSSPQ